MVREAVLNAVCHRDYRLAGSVFVRQFPKRIEIVSPGGFPPGITTENILWRQFPRNRRLAEAMARCGLVERAGQGADKMFRLSIREGKPLPDFGGTDAHQVSLTLLGEIRDPVFLRFLEAIGKERVASFAVADLLVLDYVARGLPVPAEIKERVPQLLGAGVGRAGRQGQAAALQALLQLRGPQGALHPGAGARPREAEGALAAAPGALWQCDHSGVRRRAPRAGA